jgi:hypothetical protein
MQTNRKAIFRMGTLRLGRLSLYNTVMAGFFPIFFQTIPESWHRCQPKGSRKNNFTFSPPMHPALAVLRKYGICRICLNFRALLSGRLNAYNLANLFLREP